MKESNDILVLFESLNNHEVFTPPRLARQMLDLFPDDVWVNPEHKFLDPCVKSGVFLREIFYKLFDGLKGKGKFTADDGITYNLNDNHQRINHIFKNMLYGIATSELTGYVSRRTLYGVMEADSDKQISSVESFERSKNFTDWTDQQRLDFIGRNQFNDYYDHTIFKTKEYEGFEKEGNIYYPADEVGNIVVEQGDYHIEDAYFPFIDNRTKHQKILDIKEQNMKFDVIIGNPPYQLSDGGARASASPIYQLFVRQAKKLNPKYLIMIIPSRWFSGGKGLDDFREEMLKDKSIRVLHDYWNAKECFGEAIKLEGGVCYFLWDRDNKGDCDIYSHKKDKEISKMTRSLIFDGGDTFIRYNEAISIIEKVKKYKEEPFSKNVSSRKPFGLDTLYKGSEKKDENKSLKVYQNGGISYINRNEVLKNHNWVDKYKVFISMAYGMSGEGPYQVINKPFYGDKNTCCTETYLLIGPFDSKKMANNVIKYISTKFFRFLVLLRKPTQHATSKVYQFVPVQDFNKEWDDESLYKKYNFTSDEIDFIESLIRPMELLND